jgi:hypothetical protein
LTDPFDFLKQHGPLKFSPITESQLVGGPEVYANIQAIRKKSQNKLKKHMLKIDLYVGVSFVLSYFSAAKIASWLPESLTFVALLIVIGMLFGSIYIINTIQKDYMRLIDYELYYELYFDLYKNKNLLFKKGGEFYDPKSN